jgi:hypothetical protein
MAAGLRSHAQTNHKILPAIKDRPVPILKHCILYVITLTTFVVTLYYRRFGFFHRQNQQRKMPSYLVFDITQQPRGAIFSI